MTRDYEKSVKKQSAFCVDLMERINDSIKRDAGKLVCGGLNYTQKQQDIIRLRRELVTLYKLCNPWYEWNNGGAGR